MLFSVEKKLHENLKKAGESQGWANASGLLLAVSGGSDSMALLCLLHRCFPGRIVVAHLEHGLRGAPALADAAFVLQYCRTLGLPCFVRHGDIPNNKLTGESSEMAGRRIRYAFFEELLEREGLPFVATGHTAGDVVETMLFHLFRGTGFKGLAGIAPRMGKAVRPLIRCTREDLQRFLRENGVEWREDETNAEDCYRRNKIRNRLLPWVRSNINPSADSALLGLSSESGQLYERLEREAKALLPWLLRPHPLTLAAWDAPLAKRLSPAKLAFAVREQGRALGLPLLDRKRMNELCRLIQKPGKWRFQWAGEVELCGDASLLAWIHRANLVPPEDVEVDPALILSGDLPSVNWGAWKIVFTRCARMETGGRAGRRVLLPANSLKRLTITSAENAVSVLGESDDSSRIKTKLPWWSRPNWPVLRWTQKCGNGIWSPEIFHMNRVHDESSCAIIAKVFCMRDVREIG